MPGAAEPLRLYGVTRAARLSRDDHIVLHLRATGDAGFRHDQTARADAHVVSDVNQVVDLRSRSDDSIIHAAAVDARIRADLDVIADEAAPDVWNLAVRFSPFTGDISESVAAEHCARVYDHALAQRGPCVQRHAREELGLVAHR